MKLLKLKVMFVLFHLRAERAPSLLQQNSNFALPNEEIQSFSRRTLDEFRLQKLNEYIYEQKLNIGKQPTRLNTSLLIFNRNPKAASETIWTLLEKLSKPNQFNCYTDSPEAKKDRGSNRAEPAIKD